MPTAPGGKAERRSLEPFGAHDAIAAIAKLPSHQRILAGIEVFRHVSKGTGMCLVNFDGEKPHVTVSSGVIETELTTRVLSVCKRVHQSRKARTDRFDVRGKRIVVLTVPILSNRQIESCLCLVTPFEPGRKWAELITSLQWFALLTYGIEGDRERERENRATIRIAGYLEAIERTAGADDLPEAAAQIVESLCTQAGCERGALATFRLGRVRIRAISGIPFGQNTRSEGGTAMETLMKEAVQGNRELEGGTDSGTLNLPEVTVLAAEKFWCAPLHDGKKVIGALLFLWKETPPDVEERIRFLKTASKLLGPQFSLLQRTKRGAFGGRILRLWKRFGIPQKALLVSVLLGLGILALLPVPMPVKATCTLEPQIRRTVSAPFDGVLHQTFVEPGEEVAVGQLLAELDDREIRWELADKNARKLRAEKQSDTAMSLGRVADSQVARLEAESLIESIKVLNHRQQNLQITSPIQGLILQGDLERAKGATVQKGEMLFEVGSLQTMLAEIEIRESDIALIHPDSPVKLRFDSRPGETWKTKLEVISPRSEFRDGKNVFICEAEIENTGKGMSSRGLRPGGLGRAKIEGPRRPAIWSVLRSPVNWILQRLP